MRWKPLTALGFALLMAGCSPQPDVTATQADNNHHVALKTGDLFDIVLSDDYPTTGCRWHDLGNHDWAILRDLGQRYQADRTAPGSTYTARYRAMGGETALLREPRGRALDDVSDDMKPTSPATGPAQQQLSPAPLSA